MDFEVDFWHGRKKQLKKWAVIFFTLIFILCSFVLYFYITAHQTGLPGRRGGPQDAFRHIYASAVVSKYLSPKVIELVTNICERDDNDPHDIMDRHNNKIGVLIGKNSDSLYKTVLINVKRGKANAKDSGQVTWLSKDQWSGGL